MENKKDIGKAISEKLSTLDKTPRENVWSGINYELQKKKKRRIALFFFWTKTLGLLLIGVIGALYVYTQKNDFDTVSPNNSKESKIVNSDNNNTTTNQSGEANTRIKLGDSDVNNGIITEATNSYSSESNFKNKSNFKNGNVVANSNSIYNQITKSAVNSKFNNKAISKKSKPIKNTQDSGVNQSKAKASEFSNLNEEKIKEISSQSNNTEQNNHALFDPTSLQKNDSIHKNKERDTKKADSLLAKKEKNRNKNINMYPEDKKVQDSAKGFMKFHVDAFLSPTLYGYFSDKSTLSRFLDANSKSTELEINYGAGLSYDLTHRATIRLSYTNVKLNYTTHDAIVDTQNYSGIDYNPGITNESIFLASNNAETMDITQNISYNEIALEGRYKFLGKKIGMNGIFGFSFMILNNNNILVKTSNGFSQNIGRTKGLFETGASINIGLGLDYGLFKNTKIFLEPMFNYQAMSFENSNYKPYHFGLHFGIRYALINK